MKTKTFLSLTAIFIGSVLISSCLKNDGYQKPVTHEISDEFKSYAVFDSASFWVYKHDQSQIKDTVSIIKVLTDKRYHVDQTGAPGYYYNAIEMIYKSTANSFTKGEISAGSLYDENTTMSENYRLYYESGRFFSVFTPKYPIGQTQLLGINEGNYTNFAFHNSFYVNEVQYDSVFETTIHDYHDGNDTVFMHYFVARHFGIIRMTKKSSTIDESWSLISSSLSQSK